MLTLAVLADEEVERAWQGNVALRVCSLLEVLDVGVRDSGLGRHSFSWWAPIRDYEVLVVLCVCAKIHSSTFTSACPPGCSSHDPLSAAIEECYNVAAIGLRQTPEHLLQRIDSLLVQLGVQIVVRETVAGIVGEDQGSLLCHAALLEVECEFHDSCVQHLPRGLRQDCDFFLLKAESLDSSGYYFPVVHGLQQIRVLLLALDLSEL